MSVCVFEFFSIQALLMRWLLSICVAVIIVSQNQTHLHSKEKAKAKTKQNVTRSTKGEISCKICCSTQGEEE